MKAPGPGDLPGAPRAGPPTTDWSETSLAGRAERWKPVPGWDGYEASDAGRIRSVPRVLSDGRAHGGTVLKQQKHPDGYMQVTLKDGSRSWLVPVHHLVLAAFRGPCPQGMERLHRNDDGTDNRLANLRYGTHSQNEQDKARRASRRARRTRNKRTIGTKTKYATNVTQRRPSRLMPVVALLLQGGGA
jgi:hypothetical protein